MNKTLLLFIFCVLAHFANAQQISLTTSLTYTQNFDALDTATTGPVSFLPLGWSLSQGPGYNVASYMSGYGASANPGFYSFGNTGSSERALGSVGPAYSFFCFGTKFINNTGSVLTSVTVSYRGEQWRSGGRADTSSKDSLVFLYSVVADNVSDTTGFIAVPALSFTSVVTPVITTSVNGNNNNKVFTAVLPVSIPPGGSIVVKWLDAAIPGQNDGLAVDSCTAVFTASGPLTPNYTPYVAYFSPTNNGWAADAGSPLKITFDRSITAHAGGNITIRNATTHTSVIKAGNSPDVTVNGNVVTIVNTGLVAYQQFFVKIDSNVFDTAGYWFHGINDSTTWHFSAIGEGINDLKYKVIKMAIAGEATTNYIPLMLSMTEAGDLFLSITDFAGKVVYKEQFKAASGQSRHDISGVSFSPGMYILHAGNKDCFGAIKFIAK